MVTRAADWSVGTPAKALATYAALAGTALVEPALALPCGGIALGLFCRDTLKGWRRGTREWPWTRRTAMLVPTDGGPIPARPSHPEEVSSPVWLGPCGLAPPSRPSPLGVSIRVIDLGIDFQSLGHTGLAPVTKARKG